MDKQQFLVPVHPRAQGVECWLPARRRPQPCRLYGPPRESFARPKTGRQFRLRISCLPLLSSTSTKALPRSHLQAAVAEIRSFSSLLYRAAWRSCSTSARTKTALEWDRTRRSMESVPVPTPVGSSTRFIRCPWHKPVSICKCVA